MELTQSKKFSLSTDEESQDDFKRKKIKKKFSTKALKGFIFLVTVFCIIFYSE